MRVIAIFKKAVLSQIKNVFHIHKVPSSKYSNGEFFSCVKFLYQFIYMHTHVIEHAINRIWDMKKHAQISTFWTLNIKYRHFFCSKNFQYTYV